MTWRVSIGPRRMRCSSSVSSPCASATHRPGPSWRCARQSSLSSASPIRPRVVIPHKRAASGLPEVYEWARRKPTGASLKMLLDFGSSPDPKRILHSAAWLHNELPIRLAHQVVCLDKLPYGLCMMPSVRKVRDWYISSFKELTDLPKLSAHFLQMKTEQDADIFYHTLKNIYERHSPTMITMARGVYELKKELGQLNKTGPLADISEYMEIHEYLDNFYMARIGIRILIGQHLELVAQRSEPKKDYVGLICRTTSPSEVARHASEDAQYACERFAGVTPDVEIIGAKDVSFPYIMSHLYYILFELLKNSLRATVEYHHKELPPVRIIIASSDRNEDVSIKVSDEGGGIPRSVVPKLWSYMYSTARSDEEVLSSSIGDFTRDAPLAGLGVGLPLARLYARYFGGDLQLMSMEGYGTDTFLHLLRLGNNEEPLPVSV